MEKLFNLNTNDPSQVMAYFREKTGLSKKEVCERLGISRPTLNKIERRPQDIAVKYLEQLQTLYGDEFVDYYIDNKMYKTRE